MLTLPLPRPLPLSPTANPSQSEKPSIIAAFNMLDRDGDGTITKNDLQDMLGRDFTPEEIDQMIKDSGASGDPPVLSFSQFKHMMLKKDGAHLHKMTVVGKLPDHAAGSGEPRSAA